MMTMRRVPSLACLISLLYGPPLVTGMALANHAQGADPTNGYVTYLDQGAAQAAGLIGTNNGAIYMGVDHTNAATGSGRQSVRVSSKKTYNSGLIILDVAHMPGGICGTWPALCVI